MTEPMRQVEPLHAASDDRHYRQCDLCGETVADDSFHDRDWRKFYTVDGLDVCSYCLTDYRRRKKWGK